MHIQDLPSTPRGIWPTGDISADGNLWDTAEGTAWAQLEQEPDKAARGIGQPWQQVQPGQVQKTGLVQKQGLSALLCGCPSAVVPVSSVTLMLSTEKKLDTKQLCKGSSLVRCYLVRCRCLILYEWVLTEVQHHQGVPCCKLPPALLLPVKITFKNSCT